MSLADIDYQIELDEQTADGSNNPVFAHYAEAGLVTESYVLGTPIVALCGKIFVPHRNPERYPVCPSCKELLDAVFYFEE